MNLRPSNVIGMNSFNRCKGLDDSYFPGLGSNNHISERFSTWSVWRSGGRVTDLWGPFWVSFKAEVGQIGERQGNADKEIWTKCCRMLEMIRCPCHGAVAEVQGESGKQEVKCGHMSEKNLCCIEEGKWILYLLWSPLSFYFLNILWSCHGKKGDGLVAIY